SNFRRQCCTLDDQRDFSYLGVVPVPALHPSLLEFVQEDDRVHDVTDAFSLILVLIRRKSLILFGRLSRCFFEAGQFFFRLVGCIGVTSTTRVLGHCFEEIRVFNITHHLFVVGLPRWSVAVPCTL